MIHEIVNKTLNSIIRKLGVLIKESCKKKITMSEKLLDFDDGIFSEP